MKEFIQPETAHSLEQQVETLAKEILDQLWNLFHAPFIVRRSVYGAAQTPVFTGENNWFSTYGRSLQKKVRRLLSDKHPYEAIQAVRQNPFSIALALYRHLGTKKAKLKWYNFFANNELERWLNSSERLDVLLIRELQEAGRAKDDIVGKLYTTRDAAWDICVLLSQRSIESDGKQLGLCIESLKTGSRGEPYLKLTRPLKEGEERRRLMILSMRAARDTMINGEAVRQGESVLTMSYDPDAHSILEVEGASRIVKTPAGQKKVRTFLRKEDPWYPAFLEFVNKVRRSENMPVRSILSESPIPGPGTLLLDTGEEIPLENVFPPTLENQKLRDGVIAGGYMTPFLSIRRYNPEEFARIGSLFPMTLTFAASGASLGYQWQPFRDELTDVHGSILDYGKFPEYRNLRTVQGTIGAPDAKTVDAPKLSYLGLGLIAEDATSVSLPSLPETARIFTGKNARFDGPMMQNYPERIFKSRE